MFMTDDEIEDYNKAVEIINIMRKYNEKRRIRTRYEMLQRILML